MELKDFKDVVRVMTNFDKQEPVSNKRGGI
jgi:hypothetical protein